MKPTTMTFEINHIIIKILYWSKLRMFVIEKTNVAIFQEGWSIFDQPCRGDTDYNKNIKLILDDTIGTKT